MDVVNEWPEAVDPISFIAIVEGFAKSNKLAFDTIENQYIAIKKYEQKAAGATRYSSGLN